MRAQDCTEGSEDQKKIAILLEGKVTRKASKVFVYRVESNLFLGCQDSSDDSGIWSNIYWWTTNDRGTVFSGTLYCAITLPLQKQLKDSIPRENLYQCSIYLIDLVFKSLAKMFSNAREIQVSLDLYFL